MQDQAYIEEALESARNELHSGERVLTVGRTRYSVEMLYTKVALVIFGVVLAITLVCLFLSTIPFFSTPFSFLFICCVFLLIVVCIWLPLAPLMDLFVKAMMVPIEEICIITNQRILTVTGDNCTVKETAKKKDIAKLQSFKSQLTLTLASGTRIQMDVVEGLLLSEISSMQ